MFDVKDFDFNQKSKVRYVFSCKCISSEIIGRSNFNFCWFDRSHDVESTGQSFVSLTLILS